MFRQEILDGVADGESRPGSRRSRTTEPGVRILCALAPGPLPLPAGCGGGLGAALAGEQSA